MIEELQAYEDIRTEFQSSWTVAAQKTLIAFANSVGGRIYFGVSDSGEAIGLARKEVDEITRAVSLFCRNGVEPPMFHLLRFETVSTPDRKTVLKVTVMPGFDRPYAFRGRRYTDGAYVRDGASSERATEDEIRRMICDSDPVPWEARPSRQASLTFSQAAGVFEKAGVAFTASHYAALRLTDSRGNFLNLGELLSDQNTSRITFGYFSEDLKDFLAKQFSGSILLQMDQAFEELKLRNPVMVRKTEGLANERTYFWPPRALRESLVNCAFHRDYAREEPAKVSVFPDRFEFLSYGSIPGDLSVDEVVIDGVSSCRNPALAAIFQRLGWMENYGSGFPLLWREYAGTGSEPKLEATRRIFRILLPRIVPAEGKGLVDRGIDLFRKCDSLSTPEIMAKLQVSRTSANTLVHALMKEKFIEKTGAGRFTRYRSLIRSVPSGLVSGKG